MRCDSIVMSLRVSWSVWRCMRVLLNLCVSVKKFCLYNLSGKLKSVSRIWMRSLSC